MKENIISTKPNKKQITSDVGVANEKVANLKNSSQNSSLENNAKTKSTSSGSYSKDFTANLIHNTAAANFDVDVKDFTKDNLIVKEALEGIKPQDEIESMIASQLLVLHNAALKTFKIANLGNPRDPNKIELLQQAANIATTFTNMTDLLVKYRNR